MFFEEFDVFPGIFVFDFAVIIIIEIEMGNAQLDKAPEEPVNIGEGLEHIGFEDVFVHVFIFPVDRRWQILHLASNSAIHSIEGGPATIQRMMDGRSA